jgi:hypothetical protein
MATFVAIYFFFTRCEVISVIQSCKALPHKGWPKHFLGHRLRNIFDKIKTQQNYVIRFEAALRRICGEQNIMGQVSLRVFDIPLPVSSHQYFFIMFYSYITDATLFNG